MVIGNASPTSQINNELYHQLGERWYTAQDDPVALLRAESRTRNPWVADLIRQHFTANDTPILDIGCGGGFLSNHLAQAGFRVMGLDASAGSLRIAQRYDATSSAWYVEGNAYHLPYDAETFQAVCAMDFLEHVEAPAIVVAEAARVLRPGGLFFFATFNRNFISWLIGIKGVEWFVKNTPPRMHELSLFIKPAEMRAMCQANDLRVRELHGFSPVINRAFWRMLATGVVGDDFRFRFVRHTIMGYLGVAVKAG